MVSRSQYIAIAIGCFAMLFLLLFFFSNIESMKDKIFVGFILIIPVVVLILTLPWIPRFRENVTATTEGIGFDDQFFPWSKVTRLSSPFGGRIDVYLEKESAIPVFCFGIILSTEEFQEGYKHIYSQLLSAHEKYQTKFK